MDKRYIDVNRLCEWLKNLKSGFTKDELVFRDELIEHLRGNNGIANVLPTVDVAEVVRCKDCEHYLDGKCYVTNRSTLFKYDVNIHSRKEDDFCSYGTPKERR